LGWPDKWKTAEGWSLNGNHCQNCANGLCTKAHHQSPINLERNRAIVNSTFANECIDIHWMAYYDSTCSFEDLQAKKAFRIDRHALRIIQPMREVKTVNGTTYELDCANENGTKRWGKVDFSRGFSNWWHLSHIDFHMPSEHTQEGKRYDAELQLYHFYSVTGKEAGVDNEMATISIFLQAYDKQKDYPILNRVICAWREAEEKTRRQCGLPSVTTSYPGCFFYGNSTRYSGRREAEDRRVVSAHDIIVQNHIQKTVTETYNPVKISLSDHDFDDMSDFDWDGFIEELYETDNKSEHGRHLLNYEHVPWFNYFPMTGVKTEYYYRYSGSQTIPPCYGSFFPGTNRKQTNHWRVMKDPILVGKRQIAEMNRLLRERIAPPDDPIAACKRDTAAIVRKGKVSTARPLQDTHKVHFKVFCECQDWKSKFVEDQQWCKIKNQLERYYGHPYNFESDGF
jgi:carbonic anhydrase